MYYQNSILENMNVHDHNSLTWFFAQYFLFILGLFPVGPVIQKNVFKGPQLFAEVAHKEWIQDGGIRGSGVAYSLNKHKRWDLPDAIQDQILSGDNFTQFEIDKQYCSDRKRRKKSRGHRPEEGHIHSKPRTVLVEKYCTRDVDNFYQALYGNHHVFIARPGNLWGKFAYKVIDSKDLSQRQTDNW